MKCDLSNEIEYENWHKHTKYSNLSVPDSIISIEDIAKRSVELGHKILSTVEHGFAGNVFEYYDVAEQYNLKMVFGVEFYYVNDRFDKDRSNSHLLIMARNNNGKRALTKLISVSNKTGYYYKPRIDKELLFGLCPDDVVITSTCVASYIGKHDDYEKNFVIPLIEHFGDNFYLEIHDNVHPFQIEYNKKILSLHNKYNIPFVHANDTHYIHPEDSKDRDDLLKGKGIFYPEEDGFILDYPISSTILERYERQGVFSQEQVISALQNTLIAREFEDIKMDKEIKMPTLYPNLTHQEKVEKLKDTITKEWRIDKREIDDKGIKEHLQAIRYETHIVEETYMEDYFLLNYKVIKRAKEKGGILTRTGRGSAPSFYVNKLLGFTEMDRVEAPITLYPTRFMSKSRILETKSLPDVDFNTANPEPFIDATREILGEDQCYYMTAYGTMQESEAFRNLCRARNIDKQIINEVGKNLDYYKDDPKWKDLIEESKKFIGVIDSVSPHPCANLIMNESISEEVGLIRTGDGKDKPYIYCALIDSDTSDAWKYLKNDYLTVTVWRIISEVFKSIDKPIYNIRELTKATEGKKKVWDLYKKGLTATLNQTGTDSGNPQVMRYMPKNIRELSGWVSAIRPQFKSMKDFFLDRKDFSYGIEAFDKLLENSDNFILYQEDIMKTLVFVGFPEDETYGLLKKIAKKKEGFIEKIEDQFIDGFTERTGNSDQAKEVWKIVEDAVGYGFNSSHAYAVALDSLYGAYLKANYPLEYYSVVFNIYENDTKMTAKLKNEMMEFGITTEPIKFGKSRASYTPNKIENIIYKGIKSIKYLSIKAAEELYELASTIEYDKNDFVSLLIDIFITSVNTQQMEILIMLDFFKEFGEKEILLEVYMTMADKKKANFELYPEFADYSEVVKGENKIKKIPLKYDAVHKEKTKNQRLENLHRYEKLVRIQPPEKIGLGEQIMFEKKYLGYADTTINVSKYHCIVTEINTKYTPRLTFYQLSTGKEITAKIKKKTFFNANQGELCSVGDYIEILSTFKDGKWKKTDDGFEQDMSQQELFISNIRHIT